MKNYKTSIKYMLKQLLPDGVLTFARALRMYTWRIRKLWYITTTIRGVRLEDNLVLIKSILLSPFLLLKNLKQWQEPYLLADAKVYSHGLGVFYVRKKCDDLNHVMMSHDFKLFEFIKQHVKEGDTVIDAGANIGGVTVFLGKIVGSSGSVLAFEMIPDTANYLKQNIALNNLKNIKLIENALSNEVGKDVYAEIRLGYFGQSSIAVPVRGRSEKRIIKVKTTTLDHCTEDISKIAFLKLDIEGAELLCLEGADITLTKTKFIVYENWQNEKKIELLLNGYGFEITHLSGNNYIACNCRV